jgi:anaerobic selenocysteine-containing dehydrogenase
VVELAGIPGTEGRRQKQKAESRRQDAGDTAQEAEDNAASQVGKGGLPPLAFEQFERSLKELYAEYTFEFAAQESGVDDKTLEAIAKLVSTAGTQLSSHNWRSVTSGVSHGWSVARCLFMLNCLLGAVATEGGVFRMPGISSCPSRFIRRHIRRCGARSIGRRSFRCRCTRCLFSCHIF